MKEAVVYNLVDEAADDMRKPEEDQASHYPQDRGHLRLMAQPGTEPNLG